MAALSGETMDDRLGKKGEFKSAALVDFKHCFFFSTPMPEAGFRDCQFCPRGEDGFPAKENAKILLFDNIKI